MRKGKRMKTEEGGRGFSSMHELVHWGIEAREEPAQGGHGTLWTGAREREARSGGGGRGGGEKEPLRSAEPFSWFGCMV